MAVNPLFRNKLRHTRSRSTTYWKDTLIIHILITDNIFFLTYLKLTQIIIGTEI